MRLLDILNGPWAITMPMLDEIQAIYGRHLRGEKIDLAQLSAETGLRFENQPKGYAIHDGVAVLPIDGVIAKRMNLFSKISGGTSSELVGRDVTAAMQDPAVQALVLSVDSPGGSVDGTPELAQLIYSFRGVKPIITHTDGTMASAAYWIGSAADTVLISSEVVNVGDIGVVTKHIDKSMAESKAGQVTTEIYAGKYKRIASQYSPLSEEGRAYIQAMVDHAYSVFVDDVARHRGVSTEDALSSMADGRLFLGSQAIEAGLVDGVATLAEAIAMARDRARSHTTNKRAGVARAQREDRMDLTTLRTDYPDLVQALTDEVTAGFAAELDQARIDGAKAELDRINDVRSQLVPGHEALIDRLAFDGVSTGNDAARAIIAAEKDLRAAEATRMDQEANPIVPPARPDEAKKTVSRAEFDAMADGQRRSYMAQGGTIV